MKVRGIIEPPYPNSAHHKVLSNSSDPRMVKIRDKMKAFGIDINDADNGVFLPRSTAVKEDFGVDAMAHSRVHTDEYIQSIYDKLNPTTTADEFRTILRGITF